MECKPWEMDEGMSLIMMRMRRSLRTVLREAVLEEGLTPNEIEVLLFLEHGTYNTARDISRLRGMPRSLVSKAVDQLVRRGYVESSQDKQDRRVSRLQLLPASQSAVQRLAQARGDFLSKLWGDPRGICRLFLHGWENGGQPGGYAPGGRAAAGKRI
ncbi:transcriptional regulator MarR family [Firmicutes bacterium CAG:94]|nr:transcriptional regulator MarR family [Firmicutes bacterium CAG:94]